MITDNDLKKLKTVFATKSDLERYATKKDLKLWTDGIISEIGKVLEAVGEVANRLDTTKRETNVVLDDHENRITVMEKKVFV